MKILKIWHGISMPGFHSFCLPMLLLLLSRFDLSAQYREELKVRDKTFQFSLFPGISTNGISTWKYYNKYSFNLFGGLSAGNKTLEIGTVSNLNLYGSSGIQIAGLANIVGANAFTNLTKSERRTAIKEGFEANTHSIQMAGFLNFVHNNVTGFQIAGGINVSGNDFMGFQAALIGNAVGGHSKGIQLSGLYNVSSKSTTGFQFSSLYNMTHHSLAGMQIALINYAKTVSGKKSPPPSNAKSSQLGLVNVSKNMAGLQIGLVNFGGSTVGTQIGIINFFSTTAPKQPVKNGTPIGLLNFGSSAPLLRLHSNELFLTNLEITTGNCSNCTFTQSGMPYAERNKKFNQNALIVGVNYLEEIWGFGYGFQKLLFNKYDMTGNPKNGKRMMSYGIQFLHLNSSYELDKQFNLLTKIHFEYGRRGKRTLGLHIYTGVSINLFLEVSEGEKSSYIPGYINSRTFDFFDQQSVIWPGYSVGIQF